MNKAQFVAVQRTLVAECPRKEMAPWSTLPASFWFPLDSRRTWMNFLILIPKAPFLAPDKPRILKH